jgi:hypothetical protein
MTEERRIGTLRTIRNAIGLALMIVTFLVGAILLYAGIQNYLSSDSDGSGFSTTVLGISIISFPLSILFGIRMAKSYKKSRSRYEMPDTPFHFFLLAFLSSGFLFIAIVALLIFIVYSQS